MAARCRATQWRPSAATRTPRPILRRRSPTILRKGIGNPNKPFLSFIGEEAEAGAGAEPPRGRPRRDPFPSALQLPLPPITKEWIVLPPVVFPSHDKVWSYPLKVTPFVHLGFDAAVPSHFVVFASPGNVDYDSEEVGIYSSETGQWTYMQSKWVSVDYVDHARSARVFLNGTMHLITLCKSIFTVDVEGKVWSEIQMPNDISSDINDMSSD
ncbi:hypothetical protein CFC21_004206 [Triticum aestivum]|uniref:F-box protein At3g26010-like beta-propeller domain-containing protein n=1 Tax=Triticum aestivum TaxID=4565 RepID=A0A3B5Y7U2_WHEAT|nr:hypothetical protein CFC21_004206 [Triticum aestivum]